MGRDRKPTPKEIADAEREIENLRKGGSGKGNRATRYVLAEFEPVVDP